jgi:hypothetical protein
MLIDLRFLILSTKKEESFIKEHWLEKQFSTLAVFSITNFWGRFEALNDVFGGFRARVIAKRTNLEQSKIILLGYTFPMGYRAPKTEIVCKSYDPGNLMY